MFRWFLMWLLFLQGQGVLAAQFADPVQNVTPIFTSIDERLSLMQQVAAWKWRNNVPVHDAVREQEVLEHAIAQSKAMGFSEQPARRLFALQIEWARRLENRYIDAWRKKGFDTAIEMMDLKEVVRPRLDRITKDLLRAVYVSATDVSSRDRQEALAAGAATLAEKFDLGPQAPAELVAALGAMHVEPVPTLERVRATGVLKVGTTGDYAPFSSDRAGQLQGADIELAQALASALAAQAVFVRTSWPTLLQDFATGAFDLAMSGITPTPARRDVALFSVPYQVGGKAAIVRCADVSRFDTLEKIDKKNVRVIVNPGGTNEQFVRERVRHATIHVHPDNRTVFDEIIADRADAMLTDDIEVTLQAHRHPELCASFREPLTRATKAAMLQRDPMLKAAVDEWLTQAIDYGEVKQALERAIQAEW